MLIFFQSSYQYSMPETNCWVDMCKEIYLSPKCFFVSKESPSIYSVKVISSVNMNSSAYLLSQWSQNAVKTHGATTFPSEMQK